jgi:hypothetical protein
MHHTDRFTYNLAKIEFSKIVEDQKDLLPSLSLPLQLTYTYYTGTKRLADLSNHCVFVDKFFSDALVQLGYIPDDSYMYIRQVIYKYGWYDKDNGRIEVSLSTMYSAPDVNELGFTSLANLWHSENW